MRKIIGVVLLIFFTLDGFSQSSVKTDFPLGEEIRFKIYYGWFALGEASLSLGSETIKKDNEEYYQSRIEAKTIGLFSWLAGLNNLYLGHVNVKDYKTVLSEKHLDERKGKFDQWNVFDYERMQTDVKIMNYRRDNPKKEVIVNLNDSTYDLHGTYLFLRSKLWSGFEEGEKLMLNTYWVDKLYDFGMEYGGTERIRFNGKKVTTHKFYGLFPVSTTFPKEKAVVVWVLERNGMGIPLAIEADLKVGKVRCELKEYSVEGKELLKSE
ncbi:MAG: DUF3108 domain-containing protein [Cyclobacteriaceae bacterium]